MPAQTNSRRVLQLRLLGGRGAVRGLGFLLVVVLSGCHKHATRNPRYATAPASTRSSSRASESHAATRPVPNLGTAKTTPYSTPPPASTAEAPAGKPISTETGLASWYGPPYNHRAGADGTVYDQNAMTAAHRTLPMGTIIRVTNLENNQSAIVRITDRGPFVHGRILDLSLAAAKATGVYRAGVAKVKLEAWASAGGTADPGGRWCVQVGAFAKQDDAYKLRDQLARRYTTAKVIAFAGPTGFWVRATPAVPDHAHADEVANGIHPNDPGAEPYLVRTN